ncbi:MAG: DUF433 domain-containing protein [Bacteroidota bacterium]|jgi:uncharacterized protein (DUF433 family)|nr:DUF433 domain-containing protein [Bacteroidota bacterium]MCA4897951.1 DUF433 domain-containing protein [Cytophagales bacterium]MCE2956453.1 DUF433 domain-containing protein [Flammeovirgaceae bacterium]MCZ8069628.1 DUF433 domain-containing protein [Cytophagales bacterium]
MESLIDRITIDPQICNGKPVVRGMRITVKTVLDFLAAGETIENLLKAYPYLQREDIYACIHYASLAVDMDKAIFKISA